MVLNGKEYGLLFTVRARINIANMCPDRSFGNIDRLFSGTEEERYSNIEKIITILNEEYERAIQRDKGVEIDPAKKYGVYKEGTVYDLLPYEVSEAENAVIDAIKEGSTRSVDSKEVPSKKKDGEKESSQ